MKIYSNKNLVYIKLLLLFVNQIQCLEREKKRTKQPEDSNKPSNTDSKHEPRTSDQLHGHCWFEYPIKYSILFIRICMTEFQPKPIWI